MITAGSWTPPLARRAGRLAEPVTVGDYSPRWLAGRKVKGRPLAERTRDHYQDLLDRLILPTFADVGLKDVTPEAVAEWYDTAADTPTYQAHAYSLLRAIMRTAADPTKNSGAALIPFTPAESPAGLVRHQATHPPGTAQEVATIVSAMPERHRLMVLLADGRALRFGELAELRRSDTDLAQEVIRVRRGVVRSRSAGVIAKAPKSEAGIRDVPIPPDIINAVCEHKEHHAAPGPQGLILPDRTAEHLSPSAFYGKTSKKLVGSRLPRDGAGTKRAASLAARISASTISGTAPSQKPRATAPPWRS